VPLFIRDDDAQPPFFFIHWLSVTSIGEEKNPIAEGGIELRQCKYHAIAVRSFDQEIIRQRRPT
jgi:phosphatidylethanolamine-binding protein (PEBP) family uncharacterized protein